jgi:hypothetical protein
MLHLKPAEYAALLKSGNFFGNHLDLVPNARAVRVFVRESSGTR